MDYYFLKIKKSRIKNLINLDIGTKLKALRFIDDTKSFKMKNIATNEIFSVKPNDLRRFYKRVYYTDFGQFKDKTRKKMMKIFDKIRINKINAKVKVKKTIQSKLSFHLLHTIANESHKRQKHKKNQSIFTSISETITEKIGYLTDARSREREINTVFTLLTKLYPETYLGIETLINQERSVVRKFINESGEILPVFVMPSELKKHGLK